MWNSLAYMITRASFIKGRRKAQREVEVRLRDYLHSQREDEVHTLRTAIRRYGVSCQLLPKSLRRNKKIRKQLAGLEKLFKLNNRIRDLDIVRNQLAAKLSNPDLEWLVSALVRERAALVAPARRLAASLPLELQDVKVSVINSAKLGRRFRRVTGGELRDIEDELKRVREDAKNARALHSLRILCKELRYNMELAPKSEVRGVLGRFEEWQDTLGAIRDLDVTIGYLGALDLPTAERVFLDEKRRERARLYARFVEATRRTTLLKQVEAFTQGNL